MKSTVIPTATSGTIRVPKLKKAQDGNLLFKSINDHPLIIEIFYLDKSLGRYAVSYYNEIILLFFQKLAKFNNGFSDRVEENLENLEKHYLKDKHYINDQLSIVEKLPNPLKEYGKKEITKHAITYPIEYTTSQMNYIIGLTEKQNIIRTTLEEHNLLMKDLASFIGINVNTLKSQASKNDVTSQVTRAIELYIENMQLKKELEKYKNNS